MDIQEIKFGEGLGAIKFGMSRDQVKALLGEPDDIDQFEDSDLEDDSSVSWHYDELEISLSFDEDTDWKLVTIAASAPSYLLNSRKIIGLKKDELLKEVDLLRLGPYDEEDWSSEEVPNHTLISFTEKQVNFWFEEEELTEIQWGPFFEDEENIKWPIL